jgi:simple sugar transport system substrate-binding protein
MKTNNGGIPMFRRHQLTTLALAFVIAIASAGCRPAVTKSPATEPTAAKQTVKIGFIFSENVVDDNWSHIMNQSRLSIEKAHPNVKTFYVEAVPVSEEATRAIEQLVADGCQMIILGSYYADFAQTAFKAHPDITFVAFDFGGEPNYKNVAYYQVDTWRTEYLDGYIGGLITKTNKLGFIEGFPGDLTSVNSFTLGARAANPEATVKDVFVNSWSDPVVEKQLASALAEDGADYISGLTNSINFVQAAEEHGVWVTALYSEQSKYAPTHYVTSMMVGFDYYYEDEVNKFLAGTWTGNRFDYLEYGKAFYLGTWGANVPEEVRQKAELMNTKLIGQWWPFVGPISDNTGKIHVPEGQSLSFDEMFLHWTWPVEGLEVSK